MVESPRHPAKHMEDPAADRPARSAPQTGSVPVELSAGFRLRTPPGAPPARGFPCLILLHGFGENGALFDERLSALDDAPYARLFPDGPFPVDSKDASGRSRIGRSWYQYDGDQARFLQALAFAERHLEAVFAEAARLSPLDPTRVVLLGYSQGGYLAGVAALRDRTRYRGLVGVACRIKTEALGAELGQAAGYPVLLVHGRKDEHTPLAAEEVAHAALLQAGVRSRLVVHDGGHGVKRETVPVVDAFVREVLGIPIGGAP